MKGAGDRSDHVGIQLFKLEVRDFLLFKINV